MTNPKITYQTLPDGTLKHINPLTGSEVWTVPDRAFRPFNKPIHPPNPIKPIEPENYCDFCQANYFKTPPEKDRLVQIGDHYEKQTQLSADKLNSSKASFRRVNNLFEIVPLAYWLKNHDFQISAAQQKWKKDYLSTPHGLEHILQVTTTKLKLSGKTQEELSKMPLEEKLELADPFFSGGHELIIGSKHLKDSAKFDTDLVSSGELSIEEHYQYIRFSIDALINIYANNPFIRYVMVFQNWLYPAGASIEHLHRQLVGMDKWADSIESELTLVQENPSIYNQAIINFAIKQDMVIAENDHAIAVAEIGHRFPTLAIYSKSSHVRPEDHTNEELRGVSDLLHACHAATGNQVPSNEEWYYTPRGSKTLMPWRILIKWRINTLAGFEGGTKIYLNPISPLALKTQTVSRMTELRNKGKISHIKIDKECSSKTNPLLYQQNSSI